MSEVPERPAQEDLAAQPARPPAVPADARWRPDLDRWEAVALDPSGARTGEARFYRADGMLYMRSHFVAGVEDGSFAVYHPSGDVAREGRYRSGELDGDVVARVAPAGDGEPLRACCVPEPAVEMRTIWDRGQVVSERFFDGQGRLLLSDGSLCPPRPANLPEHADFDEGGGRWIVNPPRGEKPVYRFYRQDGALDEEAVIEGGWKTHALHYAADGSVRAEENLGSGGRRQGPFRRRFIEGQPSPFADARIAEERGQYRDDVPVGRFTYHDASGAVLHTVEHGEPPVGGVDEAVFADVTREAEAWAADAEVLVGQGRVALALCAFARAAARARDAELLSAALARHTVALAREPALELAAKANAIEDQPHPALLSALVAGGDAPELLRALASATRKPRAALDLVEAALLLAPDRPSGYLTRALARVEVGEDGGALADARQLEPVSAESAEFLRLYVRTLFPEWAFWPAQEGGGVGFEGDAPEGVPDQPLQPLEAVRALMQVYASRLALLREAVIARAPKRARAAWLPPALPELLPQGPVPLRSYEATITDETDEGPETCTVEIDETLVALDSLGVSSLMSQARGQWAALTFLAWSCGLSRVTLPSSIEPPPTFAQAGVAAITRYFRVQDALMTGGLRSRTAGAPGFLFHGVDVDELPRPVAEVALCETREVRALFLWLLSPENHSPFQSDLRQD